MPQILPAFPQRSNPCLEPFLALFFTQADSEIDGGRGYESLDTELQHVVRDAELGRRVVDKLVKVWLKDGREQWVLIHVEVQTSEEANFAKRMYVYNYRLFDRYNREVVSLAVLGDDNPCWRPDSFGYRRPSDRPTRSAIDRNLFGAAR